MKTASLLAWLVLIPTVGLALETSRSVSVPTRTTLPENTPVDLRGTEVSPSQSRFSREAWGMNEPEWARYLELMRGIRGSVSHGNISPLEVLGIHAETEKERRDYAKRFAQMMKEDTDRVLAFTKAYADEAGKLNAGANIIDNALLQFATPKTEVLIQPGDRLLLFTRTKHRVECPTYLSAAADAAAKHDAQLDIYFADAERDEAIRAWVGQQTLNEERIKAKRITFNHHRGELSQLTGIAATAPRLIRLRGTSAVALDPNLLNP